MSGKLARAGNLDTLKRYVIDKYLYRYYKQLEDLIVSHI